MVIAKPEWYNQRNKPFYSYGMTREGWVYFMGIILALFTGIMSYQNMALSLTALGVFLFLFMDMTIASYKSMDERAKKTLFHCHEKHGLGNDNNTHYSFYYFQLYKH